MSRSIYKHNYTQLPIYIHSCHARPVQYFEYISVIQPINVLKKNNYKFHGSLIQYRKTSQSVQNKNKQVNKKKQTKNLRKMGLDRNFFFFLIKNIYQNQKQESCS